MKNILDDYSGHGDGTTSDLTACQTAAQSGKSVLFPATDNGYVIDGTCTLASGTRFIGEPGTKIQIKGTSKIFYVDGDDTEISNFIVDGTNTTNAAAKLITFKSTSKNIRDCKISDIKLTKTYGLVTDEASNFLISGLDISGIKVREPKSSAINFNNAVSQSSIEKIFIDYTNSSSPNHVAINIAKTNGIYGGVFLDTIDILGSDSQVNTSQHGVVVGGGEHANLNNIIVLFAAGKGIQLNGSINARLNNCNVSFCTGNQIEINNGGYHTLSNCMTRGRANGALSFLITSTYGLVLANVVNVVANSCDFKSCGAGVWINNSSLIELNGCQMPVNAFYGVVSSGAFVTSQINGCVFATNGVADIFHSSTRQYATNCLFNNTVSNFMGAGIR